MKKRVIATVLALVMVFALSACNGTSATPTPPATSPTASAGGETPNAYPLAGVPVKIGCIASLSGALQDYGEQFQKGFLLGLDYITNGTMEVAGRPIELIWEDTTNTPDVAKERTLKLLSQDKVELVTGYTSSGDAAACLALYEEFETVCVLEPAAADALITEDLWNEYIFRTGRTSGQDALAIASIILNAKPDARVAIFTPDSTYGYGMADPLIAAFEGTGVTITTTEYAPADASDFTPYFLRIKDTDPDYMYVAWAGANNPWSQIMEMNFAADDIIVTTGAAEIAQLRGMIPLGQAGGVTGFTLYYATVPDFPMNKWLVEQHNEVYGTNPDIFASGGMAAAVAVCTALEKSGGVTDPEVLIPLMEGMEFDTPTGPRWFRVEDHQAMQNLFEIEFTYQEGVDHVVPKFIRVIPPESIAPPITNGRG